MHSIRIILSLISLFALGLIACDSESTTDGGADAGAADGGYTGKVILKAGQHSLTIAKDTVGISFGGPSGVLLGFPADAIQLGVVQKLDDTVNYDPWPLVSGDTGYQPPAGLKWLSVAVIEVKSATQDSAVLELTMDKGRKASLSIGMNGPDSFRFEIVPSADGAPVAYFRFRPRVDSAEGLYGLGAYLDDVNNRGKLRAMQIEAADYESVYNEAHVPVPFLIGTRGWGWFSELVHPGVYDTAKTDPGVVEATFATGKDSGRGFVFHVFGAAHPLDVTRHYYDLTGYPVLPARWALGPLFWRDENKDQAEVESDAQTMRDLDLATSAIWIDRPYASAVNSFDFNPSQFPDAPEMISKVQGLGYRMALWSTPYLEPSTGSLLKHAQDNGFFPPEHGITSRWGAPIDFTVKAAYDWWQGLVQKYTAMGIEGFKLDYGEDVILGYRDARNVWVFNDGSDERTMHRGYKLLYHKIYGDTLPKTGGFLLCRAGTWGDQVNVSVIWPGDLDATFAEYGEVAKGGDGKEYKSVGGLPASMIYGLTLGPSGFPFYGADSGGYRHSPPDKETKTRWFEQTALSTVMQIGDSSSIAPWEFNKGTNYDQEMLDWYRIYVRLHLRLFPYEWTYAQNLKKDGRAITRPLGLSYPEMGVHPSDQYMFGDHLLVAPVLKRDARTKDVIFPAGRWVDWWDGTVYEGGKTVKVDAPLGKLPLYLAEGGIIPLLRPTIDTTSPTTQPDRVDSYATTPGILYPRIFAGKKSSFVLFDGSELRQEKTGTGVTLYYKDGSEFKYGAQFEILAYGSAKPSSVKSNGTALVEAAGLKALGEAASGWFLDTAAGGSLHVKVPAGEQGVEIK